MGTWGSPAERPVRALLLAGIFFSTALWIENEIWAPWPSPAAFAQWGRRVPLAPENASTPTSTPSQTASAALPTGTSTSTPSSEPALSATASITSTDHSVPSATSSPSPEVTITYPSTPTPTNTPSSTVTSSLEPTSSETSTSAPLPTPYAPRSVLINELAWAGTLASPNDEWIELHNPGPTAIDLDGWRLEDGGDINIALHGTLPAHSYFLLERTDDTTVADLGADQIYTGAMTNSGETLRLLDPHGELIDSANMGGAAWPAGGGANRASMERIGGADLPGNWVAFTGYGGVGKDAQGNAISGTPKSLNSVWLATPTPTPASLTPAPSPTPLAPGSILINEIAWAGTLASASDEWIELHNPGPEGIDLDGWSLGDGGDIAISLAGTIPANGFLLLERTDDSTVSDIPADGIYTGSLSNAGESLTLTGPRGEEVDSANRGGGEWPAGSVSSRASMERWGGDDQPGNWGTFTGYRGIGLDSSGAPIHGTPRGTNSLLYPTPVPTWIPGRVQINEVLIRPRYDWEGTGGVTTADEFIELYNHGPDEVYLKGWWLDDIADAGSKPHDLPGTTIPAKGFAVFFRSKTRIALNDSGDTVRLMAPDGKLIDQISYLSVRAYNLSYGRLPDGSNSLSYGLWPTPGKPNLLFVEPLPEPYLGPFFPNICPGTTWPAGGGGMRASMERRAGADQPGNWSSFAGDSRPAHDADGGPIAGTPGGESSSAASDDLGLPAPGLNDALRISEIAWAGTRASANDEWIELRNAGTYPIALNGWTLTDGNDIEIALQGSVAVGAYFLLERSDDQTVADVLADQIYTGALHDAGERLRLIDPSGRVVDTANFVRPGVPRPVLQRAARWPQTVAWLNSLEMIGCSAP